jgi:hypothetical protein
MRGYGLAQLSRLLLLLAAALPASGCGGPSPSAVVEPDPAVAPFVGDWNATEFTVTSVQDSTVFFDVTEGGAFTINVQPSGAYTAIIEFPDLANPVVEIGQLSVVGSSVTLRPQGGAAATSSYTFEGADRLILDGPTEFDFNRDGDLDGAEAHIVLERAGG